MTGALKICGIVRVNSSLRSLQVFGILPAKDIDKFGQKRSIIIDPIEKLSHLDGAVRDRLDLFAFRQPLFECNESIEGRVEFLRPYRFR